MGRRNRGITLVELLASIGALVVILPILTWIISTYMDVYQQTFAEVRIGMEAPQAQEALFVQLSHLSMLEVAEPDYIAFRIPVCVEGGQPAVPFNRNGVMLAYYLSDDSGDLDDQGDQLWMARADVGGWDLVPERRIARGVQSMAIEYLDGEGVPFTTEELQAPSFDDRTLGAVRVHLRMTNAGQSGMDGRLRPAFSDVTVQVVPRNNHD